MRESLIDLLDETDFVLAACKAVLGDSLEGPTRIVADVRDRLAHPDDVILVGLAGGTGSGKSSIFNALTGSEMAVVGQVRPMTREPLAAAPSGRGAGLRRYLGLLGINNVMTQHTLDGVCLIDLPDTDSVEVAHRHRTESLLGRLDAVVWVVDPEKYRDAAFHYRYLGQPVGRRGNFIFVLNQIDRLDPGARGEVTADFASALGEDGYEGVTVYPVAAGPAIGPPVGMDDLASALETLAGSPGFLYEKLADDLTKTVRTLAEMVGDQVDFDPRLATDLDQAASFVREGDTRRARMHLTELLAEVAAATGGGTAATVQQVITDLPLAISDIETAASPDPVRRLDEAVAPVKWALTERARVIVLLSELALGIGSLRARL